MAHQWEAVPTNSLAPPKAISAYAAAPHGSSRAADLKVVTCASQTG